MSILWSDEKKDTWSVRSSFASTKGLAPWICDGLEFHNLSFCRFPAMTG
jgi:hypothetical protein